MSQAKQGSKSSGNKVQKSNSGTSSGQTRHTNKTTGSAPVGKPPVKK